MTIVIKKIGRATTFDWALVTPLYCLFPSQLAAILFD